MQTKRNTVFIFTFSWTFFLISCGDRISPEQNPETCFCDSIYKNKQTDTLKEYLCYKGNHVYKLQLKYNYEKISRHRVDDSRWLYEVFEKYLHDTSRVVHNRFIAMNSDEKNYTFEYIGEKIDSMEVKIFNDKDTVYTEFHKYNFATIAKDLCDNPKNELAFKLYSTETKHPVTNENVLVVKSSFIGLIKTSYLVKHPLDTVLTEMKECISQGQSKTGANSKP